MADTSLSAAIGARRSVRDYAPEAMDQEALIRLIWAAQGVTDETGNRTVPSAHGLHPLHVQVAVGRVGGLASGLYDYDAESGVLRQSGTDDLRAALKAAAVGDQPWVADAACVIAISADMITPSRDFADQRPFGARGARYVNLEAGAAAQTVLLQAVAEGLGGVLVAGFEDHMVGQILGLDSPFTPIVLLCLGVPA